MPPTLNPGPVSPRPGNHFWKPLQPREIELREVVMVVRRRRAIILAAIGIGLAMAALSVIFAEKEYSSTATIEINKSTDNGLSLSDVEGAGGGFDDTDTLNMDLLTQQAVIESDNTALRVVSVLKLDSIPPYAIPYSKNGQESALEKERGLPLEKAPLQRDRIIGIFKSRLRVGLIKGTRLLDITYTDTDPDRATAIANAVVSEYMDEYTQARYEAQSGTSSWLQGKLTDLKNKVEASQAKVDEFQRESGLTGMTFVASPGGGREGQLPTATASENVPLERLIELNRDLTNAEVTRIAKEAIYRMTETQDPDVVLGIGSSALGSGAGAGSPVSPGSPDLTLLQQLRQQQTQLRIQIAVASNKYGAKNPAMIQLQEQENVLDAQIRSELNRIHARAKNDLDLATLAENGIRQQIDQQEKVVNSATTKAGQLILLQEEALSSRQIYEDLYAKLEEASVTAGIRASNITVVNPARSPVRPSAPRMKLTLFLGGAIGSVLGLLGAFLWDYFDDSMTVPEQVEQVTTTPVIGAIPDFGQKQSAVGKYGFGTRPQEAPERKSTLWLLRAPRSHIAEAYRALRTALLMSSADHPPHVILIMSGSPEEGKSTTCLNTAAAFAIQGDRVVYLDADLRRAQAHKYFNTTNDVGLSNCLTSGLSFKDALKVHPEINTLFLLPAGPHPPNPSELLGSRRFAELLAEVRSNFDYVFIDTPPLLLVTDAQIMSTLVDGYVLVVRSGKTTKRLLERCQSLLKTSHAQALGIVVNAIDARSATYSGYGYYGTGSGYYVDDKE